MVNLTQLVNSGYAGFTGSQGGIGFTGSSGFVGSQGAQGFTGSVGATGGGTDQIFWLNGQTVTTSYSVPFQRNAMTAGPITINDGVTITVLSGSRWVIL